ncbi:hypothetical protein AAFF_G00285780 [Aldrovandia affinis]|uniref:Uncharacterized protein n=1 Tax=Aldrovandia affinis TaxID=143900 RepID=A0AAD7TBX8_9TELE|nr:hypothetical protein AAFF_G00285780 [Aldrovandia affinis]
MQMRETLNVGRISCPVTGAAVCGCGVERPSPGTSTWLSISPAAHCLQEVSQQVTQVSALRGLADDPPCRRDRGDDMLAVTLRFTPLHSIPVSCLLEDGQRLTSISPL